MPYSALPAARRRHYEIDGTVGGYNVDGGYGSGLVTVLSAANLLALDEETPSVTTALLSWSHSANLYFFLLFPELVDLSYFTCRTSGNGTPTFQNIQSSTNTTTGADGAWSSVGTSGTLLNSNVSANDWWRSTSPASLTSNVTGILGLRFNITAGPGFGGDSTSFYNAYLWGAKHSGATPDDIIFLESDGTTEWPNDDDWGDLNAGGSAVTHTYYVKNTSATKTANTITVKSSGSDNGKWTVSLDNASFASSKSISSLAAGATQVVYFKFTPPSPASGVYRPYAAYLEADVISWT